MMFTWSELGGILMRPVLFSIYFLSGFWPRQPKLWAFGSWGGLRFADNSAALFLEIAGRGDTGVECVWISKRASIVRDLRRKGFRAWHAWSPAGMWIALRAGVYVFDGYTKDVNHWLSRGAKRVLLRHGIGIKKIERAIDTPHHRLYRMFHGTPWERVLWRILIPWHATGLDLVIASSKIHAEQAERFFGVPRERIAVTGLPRNCSLVTDHPRVEAPPEIVSWIDQARREGAVVALYMPTFRDSGASSFQFSWEEFDRLLRERNARVLFKRHSADRAAMGDDFARLTCIKDVDPLLDPDPLLRLVDCLATDYSSVVYDFLILRKPVIHFCPDYDEYVRNSRGLDLPFDEVTPGSKPRTLEAFADAIGAARGGLPEAGKERENYDRVLGMFHQYLDDRASQRVYDQIYRRFVAKGAAHINKSIGPVEIPTPAQSGGEKNV